MVVYFLIVNLGMLANSMSGHAVVERPVGRIAGRLVRWLPATTLAAGAASAGMIAATGGATVEAAAVAVVAVAVAAVLHRAVRRRFSGTVEGRVRDVPRAGGCRGGCDVRACRNDRVARRVARPPSRRTGRCPVCW